MNKHEQAVKAVYPRASIERQTRNMGGSYYLVRRESRATMYLASGDTKAKAWKNAAERISEQTPPPSQSSK